MLFILLIVSFVYLFAPPRHCNKVVAAGKMISSLVVFFKLTTYADCCAVCVCWVSDWLLTRIGVTTTLWTCATCGGWRMCASSCASSALSFSSGAAAARGATHSRLSGLLLFGRPSRVVCQRSTIKGSRLKQSVCLKYLYRVQSEDNKIIIP